MEVYLLFFDKLLVCLYRHLKTNIMSITISTRQLLRLLMILSWIIFIGVCAEAGGILCNSIFALLFNADNAKYFWSGADLSSLYSYDPGYFLVVTLVMSIVAILKAIMFYLIVKILHEKKLDMAQPFNNELSKFLANVSYLTLGIGIFSIAGVRHAEWLTKLGVKMPDAELLGLGGADVWFFMGVTLLVITQIFKRGVEIQAEHELTV